ncbi:MAG: cytidine deaminase [Deltaproteobacteria bacterium]|nr:cytidine deaminase [Deltaproteobacteria bacterium]MBW2530817.1 cytidine deaminase [Deltaproteobacteria bacterium]
MDWDALLAAARAVQQRAYAPYSGYLVGAALLSSNGRIFVGCNVENATYGLTICAERTALVTMVCEGELEPVALQVVTPGPTVGAPCGMCRQALAEFAADMPVHLDLPAPNQAAVQTTLDALLPMAFRGRDLERRR